jgi:hypothetical protein
MVIQSHLKVSLYQTPARVLVSKGFLRKLHHHHSNSEPDHDAAEQAVRIILRQGEPAGRGVGENLSARQRSVRVLVR